MLRAIVAGVPPLHAVGAAPGARTSYRLLETSRDFRVAELKGNWTKRYRALGCGGNPYWGPGTDGGQIVQILYRRGAGGIGQRWIVLVLGRALPATPFLIIEANYADFHSALI